MLYPDLPGMRANGNPISTIPENTLVTSARPDIVLVGEDEVTLIELTIPHNSMESLSNVRKSKSEKELYQQVMSDLEVRGIASKQCSIEIGSHGHWLHTSQMALLKGAPLVTKKWRGRSWMREPTRSLEPLKSSLRHEPIKHGYQHMLYSEQS